MAPFSDYEEHENSGEEDSLEESYLGDLKEDDDECEIDDLFVKQVLWQAVEREAIREAARGLGSSEIPQGKKNQRTEMQNENVEQPIQRHVRCSELVACFSDYNSQSSCSRQTLIQMRKGFHTTVGKKLIQKMIWMSQSLLVVCHLRMLMLKHYEWR